jgi:hypothetical protein
MCFFFGNFAAIDQRLNIRVVKGTLRHAAGTEMVDPGVPGMQPVYVGAWIDQEQRDGAVRFLFSGYRCQADHDMRLLRYLAQHRRRIVGRRREALEQLTSSHQDLV